MVSAARTASCALAAMVVPLGLAPMIIIVWAGGMGAPAAPARRFTTLVQPEVAAAISVKARAEARGRGITVDPWLRGDGALGIASHAREQGLLTSSARFQRRAGR